MATPLAASTSQLSTTAVGGPPFSTAAPPRALTTRFLDFWLLGGASIGIWLLLVAAEPFRASWPWPVGQHFRNLSALALSLALFINYPHFLLSYKLAYTRGSDFIVKHWWQLIAVPLLLLALLGAAYVWFETPARDVEAIRTIARVLVPFGVNAQVVAGPRVGDVLLTFAFNVMVLSIGWHYTKQVFGCVMVYAHYDGYTLSPPQRAIAKWTLLAVWVMSIVDNNIDGVFRELAGFNYSSFDLPNVAAPLTWMVVAGSLALLGYAVVYANHRRTGRWPSANMIAPFAAIYVWWLPLTRQAEFYLLLTPLFHSLQYLPFVYKVEDSRLQERPHRELWAAGIVGGTIAAGWLAFELLPVMADVRLATFDRWGFYFFVVAATLFINIHHYFIDNVVWRFSDPKVRRYLLSL